METTTDAPETAEAPGTAAEGRAEDDQRPPTLQVLLELSAPTFGWFRTADARERGVLPSTLSWMRSRELIETPFRGCNRLTGHLDTWEGRALARQWSAGPTAALGRQAALRILEGAATSPEIDVLLPRHRGGNRLRDDVRTHVRLTETDVVRRGHFRVTTPLFTTADLAAVLDERRLLKVADRFIAARAYTVEEFAQMVDRFRQIEGVDTLREVRDQLHPSSRWTRSDGERMWLLIVRQLDVPAPEANVRIRDADGELRYLDFAWRDLKVAVEIDLHPSHGTTVGRRGDGHRQNALVLLGWTVLRFDLHDLLRRPDQVRETIARALANAAAAAR